MPKTKSRVNFQAKLGYPLMDKGERALVTVPYTEIERLRSVMKEHGVAIVTDVLTSEQCLAMENEVNKAAGFMLTRS